MIKLIKKLIKKIKDPLGLTEVPIMDIEEDSPPSLPIGTIYKCWMCKEEWEISRGKFGQMLRLVYNPDGSYFGAPFCPACRRKLLHIPKHKFGYLITDIERI